jgi:hypothetical protein
MSAAGKTNRGPQKRRGATGGRPQTGVLQNLSRPFGPFGDEVKITGRGWLPSPNRAFGAQLLILRKEKADKSLKAGLAQLVEHLICNKWR